MVVQTLVLWFFKSHTVLKDRYLLHLSVIVVNSGPSAKSVPPIIQLPNESPLSQLA